MKKTLIATIAFLLISVSAAQAEPSFINNSRGKNESRQYMEYNLKSRCIRQNQDYNPQANNNNYCQNRWNGQGRARLVPIGYDQRTGLLIMRPVYD